MVIYKKETKEVIAVINELTGDIVLDKQYDTYNDLVDEHCLFGDNGKVYIKIPEEKKKSNVIDFLEYKKEHNLL